MENKAEHTVRGIRNWLKGEIDKCVTRDMRSTHRRQSLEECLKQLEKLENGLGLPKPDSDICITQYRHPDITSGMHTNGRANMFVRMNKGDWYLVDRDRVRNQDTLRSLIAGLGIEQFIAYYCTLAEK